MQEIKYSIEEQMLNNIFQIIVKKIKNQNIQNNKEYNIFKKLGKIEKKREKKKELKTNYINISLLKSLIDNFGKIKSRYETNLSIPLQKYISKLIRKARYYGLIPFLKDNIIEEDV
jgi:ribosomal protein S18